MSGTRPDGDGATPSAPLPLPARPNLQFERKRAKKLARHMRHSRPDAQLADAQFAIAREYGFSSWPRLVDYFRTLERHEHAAGPPAWYPAERFDQQVAALMRAHQQKAETACARLAMFIPRFLDLAAREVADAVVTTDEARLVIARENRMASWDALLEWLAAEAPLHQGGWNRHESPRMKAAAVIRSGDVDALAALVEQHPELIRPVDRFALRTGGNVMFNALHHEEETRTPEARRLVEYLESRGMSRVATLNYMLLTIMGFGFSARESVNKRKMDWLLERGADPGWVAPNGYTVLEHMLTRNRSRDEINLMLQYVKPRKALWIAAALGDVEQLRRYVRDDGSLTPAGRQHRPDLLALGPTHFPATLTGTDREILAEAFYMAFINERYESMDFFLARGFPIDYSYWGYTTFHWGLNSRNARLVEYCVAHGARADIDGSTAEEKDQWLFEADPTSDDARRIYELSGGRNYDAVLARYRERQQQPPELTPPYVRLLEVARDIAAAREQEEITDENIFVAFLRDERAFPAAVLGGFGVDLAQLREDYASQLNPIPVAGRDLPLAPDAKATVDAAIQRRSAMHWRKVGPPDVFCSLLSRRDTPLAQMLIARGLRFEQLREQMERW
ncbi:MAG TPA: Clp protease N-terminal domain-containing protein [Gemmatimonadaceae bacterium]|nr:Clp protease N-terminal domain-containing protein [Gemmatimonadaceae bacterium]